MKILHCVTVAGPDGAFGGPLSVATTQLAELASRGHSVLLSALWSGPDSPPRRLDGIPLLASRARRMVPGSGFLGMINPGQFRKIWRCAGAADVVHVHAGRDLQTLGALAIAALRGRRTVVQTHGMVQVRTSLVARIFDTALRPLLRRASACLVLTDDERAQLAAVLKGRTPPLVTLPNGVAVSTDAADMDRHGSRSDPVVLYLARLHPRKRPEVFVRAASQVLRETPDVTFDLYGPNEGSLDVVNAEIERLGVGGRVHYRGSVTHEEAVELTRRADVYVLPSLREPFPMSVLESLAVGTPVVCTDDTGLSDRLRELDAAVVTDGSVDEIARGIRRLLSDVDQCRQLTSRGLTAVEQYFSISSVAAELERLYSAE